MTSDDIMIEVDDRGDADTILAALNASAAAHFANARRHTSSSALRAYQIDQAQRFLRLASRFEDALYPEPEPHDFEPEPPLPKDDPDYNGAELLQIRRQSQVPA